MGQTAEPEIITDQDKIAKLDKANAISKKWMDGEPYTAGAALDGMASCIHNIAHNFVRLGKYAIALQEMTEERQFNKMLLERFEEPGIITRRTVYRSMQVARFALDKGAKISYFADLPKMKQLMLSGADDDDIGEDGTIFGISPEEIKSTNLKDLKKIIEKQKEALLSAEETIEKGKEQLADLREKNKGLRDRTKILGAEEQDTREKLERDQDLVRGILESLSDQIIPSKLTPSQIVLIRAHLAAIDALVETWCDEVQRKLTN